MWNMKNFVYFLAWNISSFSKVIETNFLSDLNGNDETNKIAFYVENVNWDFVKKSLHHREQTSPFLGVGEGSVVCRDETKTAAQETSGKL